MAAWYSAVLASGLGAQGAGRMGEWALGARQWLSSRFLGPGGGSCSSSVARAAVQQVWHQLAQASTGLEARRPAGSPVGLQHLCFSSKL